MKTLFTAPMKYFSNVNRYTRAGRNGKEILCPECRTWGKVDHFGWSALGCTHCHEMIDKEDWLVEKNV